MVKFNYETSTLVEQNLAIKAKDYCEKMMLERKFQRGDYEYLNKLIYFYLGGEIPNFKFRQPSACHEARFMSDSLYILVLFMTSNILELLDESQIEKFKQLSNYIALFHGPNFLRCGLTEQAPNLDLTLVKELHLYRSIDEKITDSVVKSINLHSWYLTSNLVVLCLADATLPSEEREKVAKKLFETEKPAAFEKIKPSLPELSPETQLVDCVGPDSWLIFDILNLYDNEWLQIDAENWSFFENYRTFEKFAKNLKSINDFAERKIRLIQDFVLSSPVEDRRQNNIMSAKNHRQILTKTLTKENTKIFHFIFYSNCILISLKLFL